MGILSNLQKLSVILKQFIVLLFKRKHMVGFGKNGVLSWMWVCERLFEVSLSLSVLSLWKLIVCLLFTFDLIQYMYLTWWIWYSKVLHLSAKFSDLANVLHLIVNIHSEVISLWRTYSAMGAAWCRRVTIPCVVNYVDVDRLQAGLLPTVPLANRFHCQPIPLPVDSITYR